MKSENQLAGFSALDCYCAREEMKSLPMQHRKKAGYIHQLVQLPASIRDHADLSLMILIGIILLCCGRQMMHGWLKIMDP